MIKRLFAASLLCVSAATSAQTPPPEVLGKVTEVQGVVTISDGVTVATVLRGTVFAEGNRFVTASSGAALLVMDNGCVIRLRPNESLVIEGKVTCDELIAFIHTGSDMGFSARLVLGTALLSSGLLSGIMARGGIPAEPISGQ